MTSIKDVINSSSNGSCSTSVAKGLSLEIIGQMNLLVPNVLVDFSDLKVVLDASVNPFLQPKAKASLAKAIADKGAKITINSAYRTIAQQFILWSWYKAGKCGIPLAALPGKSNHEDGLAIDTPDYEAFKSALTSNGWVWQGGNDNVHYSYRGGGTRDDIGNVGIKAFQILWNKHNPGDLLQVDGIWGNNTSSRLLRSPIDGFGVVQSINPVVPPSPSRWNIALQKAPTTGASSVTAKQDNLPAGIASSYDMAKTDLPKLLGVAQQIVSVGKRFNIPPALIAALASRESRGGSALDKNGWGDRGNAFGILQVDKRYHTIAGGSSPTSQAHIEQATSILVDYLAQVAAKHPDWADEYVLKGAVVAYNSGVKNVQSKEGMDRGTTGDDYGSDVIARAKFFAKQASFL